MSDARRVHKLALGGNEKRQRYVIETRVSGGGRLGVILTGLRSPDRVLASAPSPAVALAANEFVCVDADVERELLRARAIRIVREANGERVCALITEGDDVGDGGADDGGERERETATGATRDATASGGDALAMLSGIMKGVSPRVVRSDDVGSIAVDGGSVGRVGPSNGGARAKTSTIMTPRTARGSAPGRGTPSPSAGGTPGSSTSLPLGTFGDERRQSFFSPAALAPAADAATRAAGRDDYIESMMNDFSAALLGGASAGVGTAGDFTGLGPTFGATVDTRAAANRDRDLQPFFTSTSSPASGALEGALEENVDVAPVEDASGLYGGDSRVAVDTSLGLDATPAELADLLNRSRMLQNVTNEFGLDDDVGLGIVETEREIDAPPPLTSSQEICAAFNLRGETFGCKGCVDRHVCQLCESPRHTFGLCPSLYASVHKRGELRVCLDYYLNSVDDTGGALRGGWNQEKHSWSLCPRGKECELEHVCGSCGKCGTNEHLPTCRLHAVFNAPPPVDLCRKYYLHSLGDYFKLEGDSQKFKVGASGGWALCAKGDRCHSRHICGHCGEEGRGKHKPECKLSLVCGVVQDANKAPCFLYYMKSMAGVREFEKGLLGGSAKAFCSQKKGECTGYHVCGSCEKENVSPHSGEGHTASCRMRTISNEVDPTLNPRTKQLLKDYEEELDRVRQSAKSRETASTQTPIVEMKTTKSSEADENEMTKIDVKRCRVLKSQIEAVLRGIDDTMDLLCEEAVERAGTEVKRSANPMHRLEKIREGLRLMGEWTK